MNINQNLCSGGDDHKDCIFSTPSKKPRRKDYIKLITPSMTKSSSSATATRNINLKTTFIVSAILTISSLLSYTVLSYTTIDKFSKSRSEEISHKEANLRVLVEKQHEQIQMIVSQNHNSTRSLKPMQEITDNHTSKHSKLDFIMGGFAKTGSTSLLHLFIGNNETSVFTKEMCSYSSSLSSDNEALNKSEQQLQRLFDEADVKSENTKRGIKCPTALWNTKGLKKLRDMNNEVKIIIGVRHPVSWFQSFYNYRVTEMHDKHNVIVPPAPQLLMAAKSWKGVSTFGARFEVPLMQLGKAELDSIDMLLLRKFRRRFILKNSFKIFLYHIDQLSDTNEERSRKFKKDLQDFLDLKDPLGQIPRSNINHFTNENKYPETIDICEAQYNDLRSELTKNGEFSQNWIKSKFLQHHDVYVSDEKYFRKLISRWGKDPCTQQTLVS